MSPLQKREQSVDDVFQERIVVDSNGCHVWSHVMLADYYGVSLDWLCGRSKRLEKEPRDG